MAKVGKEDGFEVEFLGAGSSNCSLCGHKTYMVLVAEKEVIPKKWQEKGWKPGANKYCKHCDRSGD